MSLERLWEHRRLWEQKPVLASVYSVWFEALVSTLGPSARVLEVGAGPGFFSAYARGRCPGVRWIASDVIEAPWNDVVADGLRLPLRSESVDAILAVDLVHHLAQPALFFAEARRVLRPGGHIAVVEPWVTLLSFPVYRFLHQEGCTLGIDPWDPFPTPEGAVKDAFEGDAAVFWRLIRKTSPTRWSELGFEPPRVSPLNGFAYLLSLGFRQGSLLPGRVASFFMGLDRRLALLAPYIGLRATAVWRCRTE